MWLILGGEGYVGKHLRREFERRGVTFVSRDLSDGDFREGIDPSWIDSASAVLLLAGVIRAETAEALRNDNVAIVNRVADAYASAASRPPAFFMSSLHVYARGEGIYDISASTKPPRNTYGAMKVQCEQLLARESGRLGFPLWIGRAANLISLEKPLNRASFVWDMNRSIREERKIVVRGAPVRDVVTIGDLATGLLIRRSEIERVPAKVLLENVCTGVRLELVEVARAAWRRLQALGRPVELIVEPTLDSDVLVGVPSKDRLWGRGIGLDDLVSLIVQG